MKKIYIVLLLVSLLIPLFAGDLKVATSVNSSTIGLQDVLTFKVIVSGEDANKIDTPSLPDIKGFAFRSVNNSVSSSFSFVNGKSSSSFTKTFTYTLIPKEKGMFTIPPVKLSHNNENFETKPLQVKVIEGTTNTSKSRTRRSQSIFDNFYDETSQQSSNDGEIFIVAEPDKKSVFKGEPINVTYNLYTNQELSGLSISDEKDHPGYGKEETYTASELRFSIKDYKGQNYRALTIKKVRLMPNITGKITVPTLELEARLGLDIGSFWSMGSPQRKIIRNAPVNIQVKDLPSDGKPASFNGAVGKFKLNAEINSLDIKAGDSFQYTLTITGEGNISNFSAPEFPELQNMRVMSPEIQNEDINTKNATKSVKYLVIAQEKGIYNIPTIEFSYFDSSLKSYITLNTKEFTLNVKEGDQRFGNAAGYVQSVVNLEGRDIDYIVQTKKIMNFRPLYSSAFYWLLILLIIISLPITYYFVQQQDRLAGNSDLLRQKNASKILKKYLNLASQHASNKHADFYATAQNGLTKYLTDKLRIHMGLKTDDILDSMRKQDIPEQLINSVDAFFKTCNQARFMPGGTSPKQISSDYEILKKLVQDISRLKLK